MCFLSMNLMYSLFIVIQIGESITKVVVTRLSQSCQAGRHCDFLFASGNVVGRYFESLGREGYGGSGGDGVAEAGH